MRAQGTRGQAPGAHEERDLNVTAVGWFVIGIIVSAILMHIGLAILFGAFSRYAEKSQGMLPAQMRLGTSTEPIPPPPFPTEIDSGQAFQQLRSEQEKLLEEYGWVDRKVGVGRIPIGAAIDLYVEQQKQEGTRHGHERGRGHGP